LFGSRGLRVDWVEDFVETRDLPSKLEVLSGLGVRTKKRTQKKTQKKKTKKKTKKQKKKSGINALLPIRFLRGGWLREAPPLSGKPPAGLKESKKRKGRKGKVGGGLFPFFFLQRAKTRKEGPDEK